MDRYASTSPVVGFVEEVVALGGSLSQLVAHMYAYRGPENPREPSEILAGLLVESLPVDFGASPHEVEAALRLLQEVHRVAAENIFMVDPTWVREVERAHSGRRSGASGQQPKKRR